MSEDKRAIRSYVIRAGRMTEGQRKALDDHWLRYGLDITDDPLAVQEVFGNDHPVSVEIGFGMGDSLFDMASNEPGRNFVGVEVHPPGVGHLLIRAAEAGLDNLRVFNADGIDVMTSAFAPDSIDVIQVFFPDPWHKKRHHKRRLLNRDFLLLLASRLKPGGILHIATDWLPYAGEIAETAAGIDDLSPVTPPSRPQTKYERRGVRLGHDVTDLAFQKSLS